MKIKSKPITNSSTTSYVMLGYKVAIVPPREWFLAHLIKKLFPDEVEGMTDEDINENFSELCWENSKNIQILEGTENGTPDDKTMFIGIIIGETDSDSGEFDAPQIVEIEELLKDIKWLEDNPDFDYKPSLILSSRVC